MTGKVEEAIKKYRNIVENKIVSAQAAKKKLDQLIELQKLKQKRLNGQNLSNNEVHQAMQLLCWNNFAGCCAPEKNCPWNKAVADALRIDYEKLYDEKKKLVTKHLGL